MKKTYKEDKELLHNFLNKTFFKAWKNKDFLSNYNTLELQMNSICDKACDYCYYHNFGEELYPKKLNNRKEILKNTDIVLDWLEREKMYPQIEVFSGEVFSQKTGFEVVEKVIDFYIRNNINNSICIPTNFSFIADDEKIEKMEKLIEKSRNNGLNLGLSCSIDGKYMDYINRPHKTNPNFYSDEYYDKVFTFCKKHNYSFHPMIYWNNIEKWIDNFLWFQEMFEKYDMPWHNFYLLEVRNDGWTKERVNEYSKFIEFVCDWFLKNVFNNDIYLFMEELILSTKTNLFSFTGTIGRGIGCSAQSTFNIRLGDLKSNLCHRTSYDFLHPFYLKTENDKIVDIEPLNINMFFVWNTMHLTNFPYCQDCVIKNLCSGPCPGSNLESTNELFLPNPSICLQQHGKIKTFINWLEKNHILPLIFNKISKLKQQNIIQIKELQHEI